ncbi:hypothetical protein [uncultured Fibrobacter sp.]|uniref:hypothetical protein n=1 Tax=uncultured Fibrobacter sp. TaxID=261512 RepID=UPI0025F8A8AF|nr:hypothetical protein [uncultured Fibrobacter sp.]
MKFLAVLILSLSLMATSSFAVSLNAPLVLKTQEDRSIATSGFAEENAETEFSPLRYLVGGLSIGIAISGFGLMIIGCTTVNNENYNHKESKIAIGAGIGMMFLGSVGIFWAF